MNAPRPAPRRVGTCDVLAFERASAAPRRTSLAPASTVTAPQAAASPAALGLAQLQAWLAEAITHPGPLADLTARTGLALGQVVKAAHSSSAEVRLDVYRYAYCARLVECLVDDFPAVQYALGAESFARLCDQYLVQYPSCSPNLNAFGRQFPDFCRAQRAPWASFIADLARLEWALVEVLHAPEPAPIEPAALAAIAPEQWPHVRLRPSTTLRVLHFDHPVDAFFQSFREEQAPGWPSPAPSATAVYRHHYVPWRLNLTAPMARLLDELVAGSSLGEALASLETTVACERERVAVSHEVKSWFGSWVAGGFFCAIDLPDSAPASAATARKETP